MRPLRPHHFRFPIDPQSEAQALSRSRILWIPGCGSPFQTSLRSSAC
jgi:hypothetical protein